MLKEKTLFGDIDKVARAIEQIKMYEPDDGYYLAFSGGKDSVVVADLVKRAGVKYDKHHSLTNIEPPELIYFIKQNHPDCEFEKVDKTFWNLVVDNGIPPTRLMRYCCKELKEKGGDGRFVLTGVRKAESAKRSQRRMIELCERGGGKRFLHPIIDWSDDEVWEYIKTYGVPYVKLYDEGWQRVGCLMCPYASSKKRLQDAERYPNYKRLFINCFDRMLDKRREDGKQCTWKDGAECFDWWIGNTDKQTDGTVPLFDCELDDMTDD